MVIKNGKEWIIWHIVKLMIVVTGANKMIDESPSLGEWIIVCIWAVVSVIIMLLLDIDLLRKLVFDKEGCTIIIGCYKKRYAWDDLKTKSLKTNKKKSIYTKCIFFSPQETINFKKLDPYEYVKMRRPLSCFCIHFSHENNNPDFKGLSIFEVNEEELKSKFEEWGVKVEGFTD